MSEDLISVIDIANEVGKRKQSVFKILRRLGIETQKLRGPDARGQLSSYISKSDYKLIKEQLESSTDTDQENAPGPSENGVFYLIQLEPDHDPNRIKLGFASNLAERLRSHKCSAPFSTVIKSWPCKLLWEKTAIECVTSNCERLHTEVFRANSISEVLEKCESFFALMPNLSDEEEN